MAGKNTLDTIYRKSDSTIFWQFDINISVSISIYRCFDKISVSYITELRYAYVHPHHPAMASTRSARFVDELLQDKKTVVMYIPFPTPYNYIIIMSETGFQFATGANQIGVPYPASRARISVLRPTRGISQK